MKEHSSYNTVMGNECQPCDITTTTCRRAVLGAPTRDRVRPAYSSVPRNEQSYQQSSKIAQIRASLGNNKHEPQQSVDDTPLFPISQSSYQTPPLSGKASAPPKKVNLKDMGFPPDLDSQLMGRQHSERVAGITLPHIVSIDQSKSKGTNKHNLTEILTPSVDLERKVGTQSSSEPIAEIQGTLKNGGTFVGYEKVVSGKLDGRCEFYLHENNETSKMVCHFHDGNLKQVESLILSKEQAIYTGTVGNNKANGEGQMVLADGSTYSGQWRENQPHGKGVFKWKTGDSYTGEFSKGSRTGYGKHSNKIMTYQGYFKEGQLHGKGKLSLSDGRTYEGTWHYGLLSGEGCFEHKVANVRYYGSFKDSRKHGFGVYEFGDGRRWEGQWQEDKQHGSGTLFTEEGEEIRGDWREGVMQGSEDKNKHLYFSIMSSIKRDRTVMA